LTELGRAMLPHIEQRYLAAQSARALAEALKRGDIVHLRLGLTNSVPSRLFSDVLNGVRNGGAAKVQTGEMHYFDSRDCELTIRHVIASGALPPAFPAVRIDGDLYWDGGILSNTPVEAVFDDNPRRSGVVFAVHMWAPNGPEPDSVWKVLARQKDLQYASRAATHVARQKQLHKLRHVIRELAQNCLPISRRRRRRANSRHMAASPACTLSACWRRLSPARTMPRTSTSAGLGSSTDGRLDMPIRNACWRKRPGRASSIRWKASSSTKLKPGR